jgi:hypothetical protein
VPQVFLNYRSADEPFGVTMLDRELSRRFGSAAVFLASKSIPLGAEWEKEMFRAVERSLALLVVMGRNWLTASKNGRRCIDDPDDFVRREILTALDHGKKVIPVRLDIDPIPAGELPEELRPMVAKQGIRVRFRSAALDMDHLVMKLRQEIPELPRTDQPNTERAREASVVADWVGSVSTYHGDVHVNGDFNAGPRFG